MNRNWSWQLSQLVNLPSFESLLRASRWILFHWENRWSALELKKRSSIESRSWFFRSRYVPNVEFRRWVFPSRLWVHLLVILLHRWTSISLLYSFRDLIEHPSWTVLNHKSMVGRSSLSCFYSISLIVFFLWEKSPWISANLKDRRNGSIPWNCIDNPQVELFVRTWGVKINARWLVTPWSWPRRWPIDLWVVVIVICSGIKRRGWTVCFLVRVCEGWWCQQRFLFLVRAQRWLTRRKSLFRSMMKKRTRRFYLDFG